MLLEHDDAANEGNPETGAKGRGEAEEMSQLEVDSKLRRILTVRFRSEGLRREYHPDC